MKRALRMHQIQHPEDELSNAEHCVQFLKSRFSHRVMSSSDITKEVPISREFWHIGVGDVNRNREWSCRTIQGSMSLHSIYGYSLTDPTLLLVRELSCFCAPCVNQDWRNCEQKAHVSDWGLVRLRPYDAEAVQVQIEEHNDPEQWFEEGADEHAGNIVEVGDNFVVPAEDGNEERVQYYILQCTKPRFRVQADFVCPWGGEFQRGEYVIAGTYYQKHGSGSNTYVYLDNRPVGHIYSHLVRLSKFPMVLAPHTVKGGDSVYKMTVETAEKIETSLQQWWGADVNAL